MISTGSGVVSKGTKDGLSKIFWNMDRESIHMPGIVMPDEAKIGVFLVWRKGAFDKGSERRAIKQPFFHPEVYFIFILSPLWTIHWVDLVQCSQHSCKFFQVLKVVILKVPLWLVYLLLRTIAHILF